VFFLFFLFVELFTKLQYGRLAPGQTVFGFWGPNLSLRDDGESVSRERSLNVETPSRCQSPKGLPGAPFSVLFLANIAPRRLFLQPPRYLNRCEGERPSDLRREKKRNTRASVSGLKSSGRPPQPPQRPVNPPGRRLFFCRPHPSKRPKKP